MRAYDPQAADEARRIYRLDVGETGKAPRLDVCDRREDTLAGADALIVVTEWNEFRSPDFGHVRGALNDAVVFDGRNLYDPEYLQQLGFVHYGIGRGSSL